MPRPTLSYRPEPGSIPTQPGVYRFRDAKGRVVYVGKAKNLRSRLSSYFQDIGNLHPRTATMVTTGASVEWTVVGTEVEVLVAEGSGKKDGATHRLSGRARDNRLVHLAPPAGDGTRARPTSSAWRASSRRSCRTRSPPGRRDGHAGRPALAGRRGRCSCS